MKVVGVDGCQGGWVSVCLKEEATALIPTFHPSFADLLSFHADADAIGVDIPIGLSSAGSRLCDIEARKVLGKPRSCSVFPAPHPGILHATTFKEASSLAWAITGKGVSQQTFSLFNKIMEVNAIVTPEDQDRVFEVHPEVSFWAIAGHPMVHKKSKLAGYDERRAVLESRVRIPIPNRDKAFKLAPPAKPDDVLDAVVAAITAMRVVRGDAGRLPEDTVRGSQGLRMEIRY